MKTKRYVGEKVRLLRNRHPVMVHNLENNTYGGHTGRVTMIDEHYVYVKIKGATLCCDPSFLRAV